jgi:hypothetical protein
LRSSPSEPLSPSFEQVFDFYCSAFGNSKHNSHEHRAPMVVTINNENLVCPTLSLLGEEHESRYGILPGFPVVGNLLPTLSLIALIQCQQSIHARPLSAPLATTSAYSNHRKIVTKLPNLLQHLVLNLAAYPLHHAVSETQYRDFRNRCPYHQRRARKPS